MFDTNRAMKRWWACWWAVAAMLVSMTALGDRIVWKKTRINESNESWRLDMEVHLSRAPDIAHVPMRFTFTPKVYYERSLLDGQDKPQLRKVPLEDRQPLIESVDMGFLDPGTGKIQKRTRFTFKLTRDRGFEAGEYEVKVENKRSGKTLGRAARLTLNGENEVIDRRSMVFEDKSEKKDKDAEPEEPPSYELDPSQDPDNEAFWEGGPTEPEQADGPLPPPAHMRERPGCGCRVGASTSPSFGGGLVLLLGVAWGWRWHTGRRRARAA